MRLREALEPAHDRGEARLGEVVRGLERLAETQPVIFPVHPRTRARLRGEIAGVILAEPLGYLDFLGLEAAARVVVTDSGGVQEETSALGVRCFTLRSTTERPVTVRLGTNTLIRSLDEVPALLAEPKPGSAIPLWDGRAGERAARVLLDELGQ